MLSKEERKLRNEAFWDGFKLSMKKKMSSNGRRVNWTNYPTGIKNCYLRMICDGKITTVCFDLQFKDDGVRSIVWEQLEELKKVMEDRMKHPTLWKYNVEGPDGKNFSRIQWDISELNFYQDNDWPLIYAFFNSRLTEFDMFYQEFKDILINLVE